MDEIEAMKIIAEKFEKLSEEECARVLSWATSKYGKGGTSSHQSPPPAAVENSPPSPTKVIDSPKPTPKMKSSKKAKSIISMDKTLNLSPSGKVSAADFASKKAPSSVVQKCVVAVYYLRETLEMADVSVVAVFTYFKTLGWPVPSDLRNTLQQAGSKGWLDTKDSEDIKLTSMGENLVEHSLPPKPKA